MQSIGLVTRFDISDDGVKVRLPSTRRAAAVDYICLEGGKCSRCHPKPTRQMLSTSVACLVLHRRTFTSSLPMSKRGKSGLDS